MARHKSPKPFMALLLTLAFAFLLTPTSASDWTPKDPCPTTIKTTIPGPSYPYPVHYDDEETTTPSPSFDTMKSIHSALLLCPEITTLDVRVALLGCSEWPDRWNLPLSLAGGERYVPTNLTTLRLRGFALHEREIDEVAPPKDSDWWFPRWRFSQKPFLYLRYLLIPEPQRSKTNLDLWLDAMDFSHVETLQITERSHNDELAKLLPRLPKLRNLHLEGRDARELFLSLPPNSLHNITWDSPGHPSDLSAILDHHGASLRAVDLHTDESVSGGRPKLGLEDLKGIAAKAPKLELLKIDLERNATIEWPMAALREIAVLPNLRNLTLYMDLASECRRQVPWRDWSPGFRLPDREEYCNSGCLGEEQFAKPVLNRTGAEEMWAVIKEERERLGLEMLEDVMFWAGDSAPPWDGPLYIPDWLEGKTAYMRCLPVQNEKGVLCFGKGTDMGGLDEIPWRCDGTAASTMKDITGKDIGDVYYDILGDADEASQLSLREQEQELRALSDVRSEDPT